MAQNPSYENGGRRTPGAQSETQDVQEALRGTEESPERPKHPLPGWLESPPGWLESVPGWLEAWPNFECFLVSRLSPNSYDCN